MVQENWERILGTVSEAKRRLQGGRATQKGKVEK